MSFLTHYHLSRSYAQLFMHLCQKITDPPLPYLCGHFKMFPKGLFLYFFQHGSLVAHEFLLPGEPSSNPGGGEHFFTFSLVINKGH